MRHLVAALSLSIPCTLPMAGLDSADAPENSHPMKPRHAPATAPTPQHERSHLPCLVACAAATAAGCTVTTTMCAAGTLLTLGVAGIPCVVAVAAACGGVGVICSDYCTK